MDPVIETQEPCPTPVAVFDFDLTPEGWENFKTELHNILTTEDLTMVDYGVMVGTDKVYIYKHKRMTPRPGCRYKPPVESDTSGSSCCCP